MLKLNLWCILALCIGTLLPNFETIKALYPGRMDRQIDGLVCYHNGSFCTDTLETEEEMNRLMQIEQLLVLPIIDAIKNPGGPGRLTAAGKKVAIAQLLATVSRANTNLRSIIGRSAQACMQTLVEELDVSDSLQLARELRIAPDVPLATKLKLLEKLLELTVNDTELAVLAIYEELLAQHIAGIRARARRIVKNPTYSRYIKLDLVEQLRASRFLGSVTTRNCVLIGYLEDRIEYLRDKPKCIARKRIYTTRGLRV